MWDNRDSYNGLAVLPFDGGTYTQAPHEAITKEEYQKLSQNLKNIDLSKVVEVNDNTSVTSEIACAGGSCDLQY